ncbi:hypothetical protein [Roseivirga sp. E12]|uniref:hypothetical protein n=1 Tax=Roseivirga sp. E12 TaxID=2819237 RepID=UPI001ABC0CE2|nr:hypothetical protein [Roseivirga sp. E12]MBO3697882.1 hypothetical protein [Roseivirga sp. E12]
MKLRKAILTVLLITFISGFCLGQDAESHFKGLKSNMVHFIPGLQGATIGYERKLWHPKKQAPFFKTITARFEGGVFRSALAYAWNDEEDFNSFYALSISGLTGKGKNHLEFGFGVVRTEGIENIYCCLGDYSWDIYPNLGYRFQKPDGKFVFRVGASHPRYTYVSVGYAF